MLPLTGSPALDRGRSFSFFLEQRRLPRRFDDPLLPNGEGDGTDTGAAEAQPVRAREEAPSLSVTLFGSTARVLLRGGAGESRLLLQSADPAGPFTVLGTALKADSLGIVEFINPGPLPPRRFYQTVQAP